MIPLDCHTLYEDAELYDQEFCDRDFEIPFYRRQALASGGPVLELACGSGRLTFPIAAAGVEIAGVDVSPAMIEQARKRSAQQAVSIDWHIQDIRQMSLGRRFQMAFIATNALQHLHDIESVLAFFECARAHLENDGVLIIDVFNPDLTKLTRKMGNPYHHKNFTLFDGRPISVEADSEYLADTQVLHFILQYRHQGQLLFTKDVRMRCFFPLELLALCRFGGFEIVARFGDYNESPFSRDAPKQILICRPTR